MERVRVNPAGHPGLDASHTLEVPQAPLLFPPPLPGLQITHLVALWLHSLEIALLGCIYGERGELGTVWRASEGDVLTYCEWASGALSSSWRCDRLYLACRIER